MIGSFVEIVDPESLHVRKVGIIVARTKASDKWIARLAVGMGSGAIAIPARVALRRDQFKIIDRAEVAARAKETGGVQ